MVIRLSGPAIAGALYDRPSDEASFYEEPAERDTDWLELQQASIVLPNGSRMALPNDP